MIGGEAAELKVLSRRHVADEVPEGRDPYNLGWVMDWLYGDAALSPMPLPAAPDPARPAWERKPARVAAPVLAGARGGRPRRRRARQLALL
ncbi:MAG TPA: hypothetical protein VFR37_15790 [Longimicrobium sp.]|nr:hypothetical protein [Longimicrobium sp.]